jgi:hypothetical protein
VPETRLYRNSDVSQLEQVVHGMPEILFAAEVAFCSLNRSMAEQELNLLDLTAVRVAQLRAGPPQIMRRDVLQPSPLAAALHDVPYDVLRNAVAPHLSSGHRPEAPYRFPYPSIRTA